jgi:hypothetical protein
MLLLTAVLAYLLGSIPFGVLVTRAMGLGDLRQIGSGNIGATNVLRTGNKGAALATLLLDGGKGAVAVLLARWLVGGEDAAQVAGLAAFLGHLSRSGWAFGRQGRGDLPWPAAGAGLARRPGGLRDLGGGRCDQPDFLGGGAAGGGADADLAGCSWITAGC